MQNIFFMSKLLSQTSANIPLKFNKKNDLAQTKSYEKNIYFYLNIVINFSLFL